MSEQFGNVTERSTAASTEDDEIHLVDLLIVLARQKKIVIGMPFAMGTMALIVSLLTVPVFTSTAVIMPPQQQNSGVATMLGQLGGLAGAGGNIAGLKNPNDLYIGMLQSRAIADKLINRFKLKERYEKDTMDDTRKDLKNLTSIVSAKDGLVSITVEDRDPKFAADLANAYVNELVILTQTLAITEASQRRLFFEKQLSMAKGELANAEETLSKIQEATGMIQLDGQVKGIVANTAQMQTTIAAKEAQLTAMRAFATSNNPDLLRLQEEIRGLNIQLNKLQNGSSSKDNNAMISAKKIPEISIKYVRSMRDVKYYESIYDLMAKQYELAKIDEAKDSSTIQLLDKAIPAEKKSKPKRALIVLVGLLGGGVLGILMALIRDAYTRSRQNKESSYRWQELSNAWMKRSQ